MKRIGIVPARPGSTGVIGKNLQPVDGVPLIVRALRSLTKLCDHVCLVSNDPAAVAVAKAHGFDVRRRPDDLDNAWATIDEVVAWFGREHLNSDEQLIVWQPTVVGPNIETWVAEALYQFDTSGHASWTLGVPNRHITWNATGQLSERRNRQDQDPLHTEVGIRFYRGPAATQHGPMGLWVIGDDVVDIDTPGDLALARSMMRTGRVHFDLVATRRLGYGHLYRCLTLAEHLQSHAVTFGGDIDEHAASIITSRFKVSPDSLLPSGETIRPGHHRAVWVADRLDTTRTYMAQVALSGWRILAIENLGDGLQFADRVVNDLYGSVPYPADWSVLRPEFLALPAFELRDPAERVLVTMGGTDPSNLTLKVIEALRWESGVRLSVIPPPGRPSDTYRFAVEQPNVAAEMRRADLVVTSGGRTVGEAAAVGVPTIVLAQNARELTHRHLGWDFGNVNLGLGELVGAGDLASTVRSVLRDLNLRCDLMERSRRYVDGRGAERIANLVEEMMR